MMRAIQGFEKNILFDTVEKGDILMKNMDQMNIDPGDIQTLFISHDHYDHTDGIETLALQ